MPQHSHPPRTSHITRSASRSLPCEALQIASCAGPQLIASLHHILRLICPSTHLTLIMSGLFDPIFGDDDDDEQTMANPVVPTTNPAAEQPSTVTPSTAQTTPPVVASSSAAADPSE